MLLTVLELMDKEPKGGDAKQEPEEERKFPNARKLTQGMIAVRSEIRDVEGGPTSQTHPDADVRVLYYHVRTERFHWVIQNKDGRRYTFEYEGDHVAARDRIDRKCKQLYNLSFVEYVAKAIAEEQWLLDHPHLQVYSIFMKK